MDRLLCLARPALAAIAVYGAVKLFNFIFRRRDRASLRRYFADKTVLITGASSGVGKELASILHECNAKITITARSMDKLEEICDQLTAANPQNHQPKFRYLDVSEPNGVENLAKDNGNIDILINNAGMSVRAPAQTTDIKVASPFTICFY